MAEKLMLLLKRCPGLEGAGCPGAEGSTPKVSIGGGSVRVLMDGTYEYVMNVTIEMFGSGAAVAAWMLSNLRVKRMTPPLPAASKTGIRYTIQAEIAVREDD